MEISRRSFVGLAAAGAATVALPSPAYAASPPGDVVGKITVGYQGWFACGGDGSPLNGWWHWSNNWGQPPSPSNNAIKAWPDVREYSRTFPTAYPNLNNGQTAALYSNYDQQTVDTHFKWMQQYGCDTAALQRFSPVGGEGPIRDAVTARVRSAAEQYGRKFYIMYDVTNWTNMQSERQTGGLHLGLRLQRQRSPVQRRRLSGCRQLVQGSGRLPDRRRANLVAHREQ